MATKDTFALFLANLAASVATITNVKSVIYGKPTEKITTDNHYVAYIHYLGDITSERSNLNLATEIGFDCQIEIGILINNTDKTYNEQSRWTAACDLNDWIVGKILTTNDNWGGNVQNWYIVQKPLSDMPKVIIRIRI